MGELMVQEQTDIDAKFEAIKRRLAMVDRAFNDLMVEGIDYGWIPGQDKSKQKPALRKEGAEVLQALFDLRPDYEIVEHIHEFDREYPLFSYTIKCYLIDLNSGKIVGSGVGSCNSGEEKYNYRKAAKMCPECGAAAIIKGKPEYGGGWVCFQKKGGCGAKFGINDPIIVDQPTGQVLNKFTPDLDNTFAKMACKRSFVAAILTYTGASRKFTQDEDAIGILSGQMDSAHQDNAPAESDVPLSEKKLSDSKVHTAFCTALRQAGMKVPDGIKAVETQSGVKLATLTYGQAWAILFPETSTGDNPSGEQESSLDDF